MSGRVHIVDDDASFRKALERRLRQAGYPCVTLYVETALVQNPSTPGFKADAKQEMLMAIAKMVEREGLDGYRIVWSVPSPALAPIPIRQRTASAA